MRRDEQDGVYNVERDGKEMVEVFIALGRRYLDVELSDKLRHSLQLALDDLLVCSVRAV